MRKDETRNAILAVLERAQLGRERREEVLAEVVALFQNIDEGGKRAVETLRRLARELDRETRTSFLALVERYSEGRGGADAKPAPAAPGRPQDMVSRFSTDLAIVCALEEELEPFFGIGIDRTPLYAQGPQPCFRGRFPLASGSLDVVAAQASKMGLVDCATLTSIMTSTWKPRYLCMSGVCGGNPEFKQVQAGDIVVAEEVFTFQTGKLADGGFRPEPRVEVLPLHVLERIKRHAKECADRALRQWHGPDVTRRVQVHFGPFGCSDLVLDRENSFGELVLRINRKAIAVDMESYAVFRAVRLTHELGTIPVVAKSVMDFAENREDDVKRFCAFVSARFVHELALSGVFSTDPHAGE